MEAKWRDVKEFAEEPIDGFYWTIDAEEWFVVWVSGNSVYYPSNNNNYPIEVLGEYSTTLYGPLRRPDMTNVTE